MYITNKYGKNFYIQTMTSWKKDQLLLEGIESFVGFLSDFYFVRYFNDKAARKSGLALNLERDSVGAVILGSYEHISEGDTVKCTKRILEVPIGEALLGRVVDSLGTPIDGKGEINAKETSPIEKIAPGVIARKSVGQPVQTGLKSIDSMADLIRELASK